MKLFGVALAVAWLLLSCPCRLSAHQAPADLPQSASYGDDDISWAQQTGIPLADFQRLRRAAGVADTHPLAQIERVDAKTLPHGRVLFVSASGTGNCLNVGVYERHGKDFNNVLSLGRSPDDPSLCRASPCKDPSVYATRKGDVTIVTPLRDETTGIRECDHNRVFTYVPARNGYQLASERSLGAYCDPSTYFWALNIVFGQHDGSERVATVQMLPSFQKESAIVFDITSDGLIVSRITLQRQLWSQLGLGGPGPLRAPSQCIDAAKAVSVEKSPLNLPRESAQRFVDDLAKMDFVADRCPRNKDSTCAYILDGVQYVVQYKDSPPIQLTDVSAFSGMKSENPALSNWVAELLKAVGRSSASN